MISFRYIKPSKYLTSFNFFTRKTFFSLSCTMWNRGSSVNVVLPPAARSLYGFAFFRLKNEIFRTSGSDPFKWALMALFKSVSFLNEWTTWRCIRISCMPRTWILFFRMNRLAKRATRSLFVWLTLLSDNSANDFVRSPGSIWAEVRITFYLDDVKLFIKK